MENYVNLGHEQRKSYSGSHIQGRLKYLQFIIPSDFSLTYFFFLISKLHSDNLDLREQRKTGTNKRKR